MIASFALSILLASSQVGPRLPKDAIVLFDGKGTSAWLDWDTSKPCRWPVKLGSLEVNVGTSDIFTKRQFGDYRLHVEFWLPRMPKMKGQNRANSGVFNQGRYEVQVLDSWNNPTYRFGGCGAIYGQKDPDRNSIRPPETWNAYDILFRAPQFDSTGKLITRPRISVWQNGIKIHDDVEIVKALEWYALEGPIPPKGPIRLQNHYCPVRYRNIWIVPLS